MWRINLSFLGWHYTTVILATILAFIILAPSGNMTVMQSFFTAVSLSTITGLNVVDTNLLSSYEQAVIYVIPIFVNMREISIWTLMIRRYWFRKVLKSKVEEKLSNESGEASKLKLHSLSKDSDSSRASNHIITDRATPRSSSGNEIQTEDRTLPGRPFITDHTLEDSHEKLDTDSEALQRSKTETPKDASPLPQHIRFGEPKRSATESHTDTISPNSKSMNIDSFADLDFHRPTRTGTGGLSVLSASTKTLRRRIPTGLHRVVSNVFIFGNDDPRPARGSPSKMSSEPTMASLSRSRSKERRASRAHRLKLSAQAAIGHNSTFNNLSEEDKELLGGIEYRSLKLLSKVVVCIPIFLHLFGIICLTPWLYMTTNPKYRDHLARYGIGKMWWVIFSSGTMTNNLGFTLTPDSMITFRDAVWPMLVMTMQAWAAHTFYPVFLRVMLWLMSRCFPKNHKLQEPLAFLLDHPRRCYTLLFGGRQTWQLASTLIAINALDVLLIICLDLNAPEVASLSIGPRVAASIFQAASSRHTGTTVYNLAKINAGVKWTLVVMMYVSVFPIALSVRTSNAYNDAPLGIYDDNDSDSAVPSRRKNFMGHVKDQFGFDLFNIFLSTIIISCIESSRLDDLNDPDYDLFRIFFEVVSGYANVGLSMGHPTINTSFCGLWKPASQVILCATMIRGRHRGLPVKLDHAVILPGDKSPPKDDIESSTWKSLGRSTSNVLPSNKKVATQ